MKFFSHEDFSTTLKYLDFGKTQHELGQHGRMTPWVEDIYEGVAHLFEKSIKKLGRERPSFKTAPSAWRLVL